MIPILTYLPIAGPDVSEPRGYTDQYARPTAAPPITFPTVAPAELFYSPHTVRAGKSAGDDPVPAQNPGPANSTTATRAG